MPSAPDAETSLSLHSLSQTYRYDVNVYTVNRQLAVTVKVDNKPGFFNTLMVAGVLVGHYRFVEF